MKKLLFSLLTVLLLMTPLKVYAEETYGYTITVYTGNEATFEDGTTTRKLTVEKGASLSIEVKNDQLIINNGTAEKLVLKKTTETDNVHFIKGFKETGRDNDDYYVTRTIDKVTEDMDFVIIYGVPGEMVRYTVRFVDENGKQLLDPKEFYGKVGDAPIVSHVYIEDYLPNADNTTKKLVEDESQNVMIFTYTVARTTAAETSGGNVQSGSQTGSSVSADGNTTVSSQPASQSTTTTGTATTQQNSGNATSPEVTITSANTATKTTSSNNLGWYIGGAAGVAALVGILIAVGKKKVEENI